MKFSTIWLFVVGLVAAAPLQQRSPDPGQMVIGYRSVSAAEAEGYETAGNTIVWTAADQSSNGDVQIGKGKYLTGGWAQWASTNLDDYNCIILANSDAWNNLQKVYIPEIMPDPDGGDYPLPLLDTDGADNRVTWINQQAGANANPSNTIAISPVYLIDSWGYWQFMIPPGFLTTANPLGIVTKCVKNSELQQPQGLALVAAYGDLVDWTQWSNLLAVPNPLPLDAVIHYD